MRCIVSSVSRSREFLCVAGMSLAVSAGCASSRQADGSLPTPSSGPEELVLQGKRLSEQGQSVRAEQYFLAAEQQGADPRVTLGLMIETCVKSGRLGSALAHAERRLREEPESPHLLRLTASLNDALGRKRAAHEQVERLIHTGSLDGDTTLFVAEFLDRAGDVERAELHYLAYFNATPHRERAPWAEPALERLQARRPATIALQTEVSP